MNTSTAIVPQKQPSAQQLLRAELEKARPSFATMLPKHVTVERLIKVVLSATARNEKLLACSRQSFVRAIMQAAELGLEIGGLLGEAYLVPFKRNWQDDAGNWHNELEAQCIVGYKGMIKLARQSGQIQSIGARAVREHDHFTVDLANEKIEHLPEMRGAPGELVAVYAIARFREGGQQIEVMTRAQIEDIRMRSLSYNVKLGKSAGPWATDYDEMARKTVVRRLCKYLPLSPELHQALELEAEVDESERKEAAVGVLDTHFTQVKPRTAALAERIQHRAEETQHDPTTGEVLDGVQSEEPKATPPAAKGRKSVKTSDVKPPSEAESTLPVSEDQR